MMIQDDLRPRLKSDQLKALESYWRSKWQGGVLPGRRDIDPWEMRAFLDQVFIVTVTQNPMRFWFRLVGTGVNDGYGEELTGRYVDEIDLDAVQKEILDEYRTATIEARPVYSRWDYVKDDQTHLRYERLLLPLSSDGRSVDVLLGGAVLIDSID
jgi:hypothetical protein